MDESHVIVGGISGAVTSIISFFSMSAKVNKDTCKVCKTSSDQRFDGVLKSIEAVNVNVTKLHERLDDVLLKVKGK